MFWRGSVCVCVCVSVSHNRRLYLRLYYHLPTSSWPAHLSSVTCVCFVLPSHASVMILLMSEGTMWRSGGRWGGTARCMSASAFTCITFVHDLHYIHRCCWSPFNLRRWGWSGFIWGWVIFLFVCLVFLFVFLEGPSGDIHLSKVYGLLTLTNYIYRYICNTTLF